MCVFVCVELGRKKVCTWSGVQYCIPGCMSDFKVLQKQLVCLCVRSAEGKRCVPVCVCGARKEKGVCLE